MSIENFVALCQKELKAAKAARAAEVRPGHKDALTRKIKTIEQVMGKVMRKGIKERWP